MALFPASQVRRVPGLSEDVESLIKAYLQGAVYSWVKNRSGEIFAARDLVGGENFGWIGTPLFVLFQKHVDDGMDDQSAVEAAGRDVGWMLKSVLNDDKRTFDRADSGYAATYRWRGGEP